jgi:hypothetical protein
LKFHILSTSGTVLKVVLKVFFSYLFVGQILILAAVKGKSYRLEVIHGLRVWAKHDLAAGVFGIRSELALQAADIRKALATRLQNIKFEKKSYFDICGVEGEKAFKDTGGRFCHFPRICIRMFYE